MLDYYHRALEIPMIDALVERLGSDQTVTNTVVITLSCIALFVTTLYFIAFFQGRSIDFWPPKIGERPYRLPESNRTDRFLIAVCFFGSTLLLSLLLGAWSRLFPPVVPSALSHYAISQITIESNSGFQNSGIYLRAGEKVVLDPDGRINLAMLQTSAYTRLAKAIIAYNLPDTKDYLDYKKTYLKTFISQPSSEASSQESMNNFAYLSKLTGGEVFRRDWLGVDGEKIDSRDLNACLLFQGNSTQTGNWGMLLAQVMANPGSAISDPFEVLQENSVATSELVPITGQDFAFEAPRDGWLTFIVNDAVLSSDGTPERQPCVDYRQALRKASDSMKFQGDTFRVSDRSIPLTWYSDNLGAFHVIVKSSGDAFTSSAS